MAADVLPNVSAALTQSFGKRLVRSWNRQANTAALLSFEDEGGVGDAKQVAWDVEFSGATAASFIEGSDVALAEYNQDPFVPAVLSWGQYRSAIRISDLELNAAVRNQAGPAQIAALVQERVFGSATKLMSVINQDIFSGTGTDAFGNPTIIGLYNALNTSTVYAGITKSQYTEWNGNVLANGGNVRPLSMDLLANLEQLIFINSGIEPDVLVCSPGVARKYENLFEVGKRTMVDQLGGQPIKGYQGSTTGGVTGPSTNLWWRGKPVIRDRNCQANTLYMLSMREIFVKPLPYVPVAPDGTMIQGVQLPSSNSTTTAPTNFGAGVYALARTGSAWQFLVQIYLQLKIARLNAHGVLGDISET